MIKHLIKYRSLVAAVFMLMPLLLWFSYSELWQFVGEKENAAAQDYCEIVKVTKTETGKVDLSDSFKLKVDKSVCPHCIDETSIDHTSFTKLNIEHFHSPQKTSPLYLYNRTFLI
ncbi:MAG: hypothetical protein FD143_70 [Ignavibacteria bacterium]|nr:MAG: hypothetical protein FD143_70 [Ignavibacteria bacterium]KAF0162515.1 MAG: hypothetical protein FD188_118 [Ignavibacteria bacterium]